jgi:hypothetical protein
LARARQPFPEHDFLLVAAAQLSNRLGGRRFHPKLVADRARELGLASPGQHAERRQTTSVRKRDVACHGQPGHEPLRLSILWKQTDPARDRVRRTVKSCFPSRDEQPPSVHAIRASDGARELGSARAEQSGDAEHLACVERKADVRQDAAEW